MRKLLFFTLFIVIGLSYLFEVDKHITSKFSFFNDLKVSYINKVISISTSIERHFNQIATIEELTNQNEQLLEYKILFNSTKEQLENLKKSLNLNIEKKPQIEFVKVLSYISFNDFTKVWLDKKKDDDKILGLISDEYAAGIVVSENNQAVALLNGNKNCSYAVFIGEEKSPGIMTSTKNKELLIKFIPVWSDIQKGDEVITSGMDKIFFEGLKVGIVEEVTNLQDMKIARVKPYVNVLKKKYFYTYKND